MRYGLEKEPNAMATMASVVLPFFKPGMSYKEVGSYPIKGNQKDVMLVSPDGIIDSDDGRASLACEFKCPVPKPYKPP